MLKRSLATCAEGFESALWSTMGTVVHRPCSFGDGPGGECLTYSGGAPTITTRLPFRELNGSYCLSLVS
jgi:hypothetical protein